MLSYYRNSPMHVLMVQV